MYTKANRFKDVRLLIKFSHFLNSVHTGGFWWLYLVPQPRCLTSRRTTKQTRGHVHMYPNIFLTRNRVGEISAPPDAHKYTPDVHQIYTRCTLDINQMHTKYAPDRQQMYTKYTPDMHQMYTRYTPDVQSVFTTVPSRFLNFFHIIQM